MHIYEIYILLKNTLLYSNDYSFSFSSSSSFSFSLVRFFELFIIILKEVLKE